MGEHLYSKRKAKAAATREQLLRAAQEVFGTRGYAGATVGAITERANTAHGTFYLYFRNKDEAFAAVLAEVMLDVHDRALSVAVGDSLHDVLEAALRGFLDVFTGNEGIWRTLLEGALTETSLAETWTELRGGFQCRVAALLDELQAAGLVRGLDATSTSMALCAMGEWMVLSQLIVSSDRDDVSREKLLATLVDVWHHALAPAAAPAPAPVAAVPAE